MDRKKTLEKIDAKLAQVTTKTATMTEAQFDEYVSKQIAKAEDEEKAGKKDDAKKRLDHLKQLVTTTKDVWSGDNGTQAIPIYNEPGLTNDKELTETEVNVTSVSSMDNDAWAGAGGPTGFDDVTKNIKKNLDALEGKPSPGQQVAKNDPPAAQPFDWPQDIASADFIEKGEKSALVKKWGLDETPAK